MRVIDRRIGLVMMLLLLSLTRVAAQTVVAFQGGEGTAADNWGFVPITNAGGPIPPGIVAVNPRTGTNSMRVGGGNIVGTSGANCIAGGQATGCVQHGNTIQFNPVNVACLSNVQLSVYTSSHNCSGAGFDNTDNVNFEVRLDGGAWTNVQNFTGFNEYIWNYTTNPIGPSATVPNPWTYNVPVGTNTFEFRIRMTVNRSDEVIYVDDVKLTTSTTAYGIPGTAGLWNGLINDSWFNPCNWDSRSIPTSATNVTFPTGSANDIVIQAGQNCVCNNLTCTGGAGRSIKAQAGPTKVLTVLGNLTNSTTAGSTVLNFSDGASGTPDGTLNLYGNWTNNSSAGDFVEGESTVNFLGSGNQTITLGTAEPSENFCNVSVNKTGGDVVLAKSIQVAGLLTLLNGKITTAANAVGVANPLPAAVSGHSTASYVNGNLVRAIVPGPGTRTYDFPLGTSANYELATLALTNPAGFTVIGGYFSPVIPGSLPFLLEAGYTYDDILNGGIWTLAPDAPYQGTYDVTLAERGYTNGGATSYINVKRPDALSAWANPGTHVSYSEVAGVVTCTRTGLTSFSDFGIARSNTVFALENLDLNASPSRDGEVDLRWHWSDRLLQGKFDLSREADGQETSLGEWTIVSGQTMETVDAHAPVGFIRYLLYYSDLDGNRKLAASTEVWNTADAHAQPMLWPNPNDGQVHLQLSAEQDWRMDLVRIDGAQIGAWSGDAVTLQGEFEARVATLPAGVYLLRCASKAGNYVLKMVRE